MGIQLVNTGALPNDGEGDPLRTAFQKINNNFTYLQQTASAITSSVTLNDTPDQVIFEYPTDEFTMALFQIRSNREDNNDSQCVFIGAEIYNDQSDVKFTVYGITNVGNWLTQYDMDVSGGNVRILVSPLQDEIINHFINYQISYIGDLGVGVPMMSQGGNALVTETGNVFITTEG
ncbi:MAG: hypothetical protein EB127_13420 [Alphaproteobacteria bacterium]|nr:hypothetical protein [Alphaproteobacteria bacterium]